MFWMHRRNIFFNITGEMLWSGVYGLLPIHTVLVIILERFDASAVMIGSIAALSSAGILLPQIFGFFLFSSKVKRQRNLIIWHLVPMLPFLIMNGLVCIYSDKLGPEMSRWLILLGFAGFTATMGMAIASWMDWLAALFPVEIRGRAVGFGMGLSAITSVGFTMISGWILSRSEDITVFGYLYFVAAGFGVISMVSFVLINDPAKQELNEAPRIRFRELFSFFKTSVNEANFVRYIFSRIIAVSGLACMPFIAVFYRSVDGGGLSEVVLVKLGAGMAFGAGVSQIFMGWLGDKIGHKFGMIVSLTAQAFTLIFLLLTHGAVSCGIAYIGIGICMGSGFLSHFNLLFETCPHDNRFAHITLGNVLLGIGAIPAPLIAGVIVSKYSIATLFTIALILTVVALVLFICIVKEPRLQKESIEPVEIQGTQQ